MITQQEKIAKKYYKQTRNKIPLFFPNRKNILAEIKSSLSMFCDEHHDFTYNDLVESFGEPLDFANSLIESESADNIRKQLWNSKKISVAIICIIVLILLITVFMIDFIGNRATEMIITTEIIDVE